MTKSFEFMNILVTRPVTGFQYAFLVFHNPVLIQSLSESSRGKGIKPGVKDEVEYVQWLCDEGEGGLLNLLHVFLHVCELRGVPKSPL